MQLYFCILAAVYLYVFLNHSVIEEVSPETETN